MMIRRALSLLIMLGLAAPAQGLSLIVWDRDLQTKLGDGESVGSRVNVRLVEDYDGPVVVLFAQTDEERARNAFPGLKSRYSGSLVNGQLTVQAPLTGTERSVGAATTSATAPSNTSTTLARFLSGFKLSLNVQPAGQSLSLPGLKTTDGK